MNSDIWYDRKFMKLSLAAKAVFLLLISNSKTGKIGVYQFRPEVIAAETSTDLAEFLKGLAELEEKGIIKHDSERMMMFLLTWWDHNKICNDSHAKGIMNQLNQLQNSPAVEEFKDIVRRRIDERAGKVASETSTKEVGDIVFKRKNGGVATITCNQIKSLAEQHPEIEDMRELIYSVKLWVAQKGGLTGYSPTSIIKKFIEQQLNQPSNHRWDGKPKKPEKSQEMSVSKTLAEWAAQSQ